MISQKGIYIYSNVLSTIHNNSIDAYHLPISFDPNNNIAKNFIAAWSTAFLMTVYLISNTPPLSKKFKEEAAHCIEETSVLYDFLCDFDA